MRGAFVDQGGLYSYISAEARVPPGGRQNSPIWATPPWRTGMGSPRPAWSRTPMAPPNAAPRRSCSRPRAKPLAAALRPVRTRPMTRPIMWPFFAPQRDTACDAEQWRHQNRKKSPERDRRTHYAARRLLNVAIARRDDRMHFRLG